MTRAEALTLAREHVEKMSANPHGVSFINRVGAVDAFARFLMEGTERDEVTIRPRSEMTARRRNLLVHLANNQLENGPSEYDAGARELLYELGEL